MPPPTHYYPSLILQCQPKQTRLRLMHWHENLSLQSKAIQLYRHLHVKLVTLNNKRVKGILKVANLTLGSQYCPYGVSQQSKDLFLAFSFMLLSLNFMVFCELVTILKLCRILSVPWNRYVCRRD
jgi:hypothetical protein